MPWQLRIQYPGTLYHVTARGNRRENLVQDNADREMLLATLAETCQKTGWKVLAWVIMDNHYHWARASLAKPASQKPFCWSMPRRFPLYFSMILLAAGAAFACSVPVFRYALEHWPADPFQVLVFHRDALSAEQEAALGELEKKEGERANVLVRRVGLSDTLPPDLAALGKGVPPNENAWLMTRFPSSTGIRAPILSAPFHPETLQGLIESPARRELARRLSEGESAVWLLLESGDKEADDAAEKLLQERLDYLASVMTLPKLDESDIANGLVSVPEEDLRLEFSVLRVARDDPAEARLVSMLLLSEEGLAESDEPMVFPVFGRGRALYALVGAGIRQETIESAAAFLVGKCSCQVKEQNPGVDLLIKADWDNAAKASPVLDRELPTAREVLAASQIETVTSKPAQTPPATESPSEESSPWPLVAVAVLLVAAVYGALRLRGKGVKRRSTQRTRPRLDL